MRLNADGTYTYTPATNFTGTVPAVYTATDNNVTPAADTATISIEVYADYPLLNDPPVAQNDTNTTEQGVPVSDSVLPNDSDPDGDPLTVSAVRMDTDGDGLADDVVSVGTTATVYGTDSDGNLVVAGTLVVNANGTYTLTPNGTFVGTVPAVYTAQDPGGLTDTATLTITVVPDAGNATFANDDASSGLQGDPQTGNILSNDNDPEGQDQDVGLIDTNGDGIPDAAPTGAPQNIFQGGVLIGKVAPGTPVARPLVTAKASPAAAP